MSDGNSIEVKKQRLVTSRNCKKCTLLFEARDCPFCARARVAAYRAANPEKTKQATRAWAEVNKEKIIKTRAEYREANKEKVRAAGKTHYEKHKQDYIDRASNWRAENKSAATASSRKTNEKRRLNGRAKSYRDDNKEMLSVAVATWRKGNAARISEVGKTYRKANYEKLLAADKHKNTVRYRLIGGQQLAKHYANQTREIYMNCPQGFHVDHIVPLKGKNVCGLHIPINLQYLTAIENMKKGASFQ